MDLLKKVNVFVLCLAVLVAVGCGKEDAEPAAPENFTSCKIIKKGGANYLYDSQGRVVRIGGGTGLNEIFEYNALNKISKRITLEGSDTTGVTDYEYNNDSLIVKLRQRSGANAAGVYSVWGSASYVYDTQKRLVTKLGLWNDPGSYTAESKILITYLPNNTVKEALWKFNTYSNKWELHSESETTFDNKKRPWNKDSGIFSIVDHNELSFSITFHIPYVYSHSRSTTYIYNSAGYPIQNTTVQDGRPMGAFNYEYECQ